MKIVSGFDVVIVGGGIAGLFTALELPDYLNIAILTKEKVEQSNSNLAQGGIAVSLGEDDSPALHFSDTLYAGAGLCNPESVWELVNSGAESINKLCSYGVNFDKDKKEILSLTREAAHTKDRIIHSGDATGKEICRVLTMKAIQKANIKIYEQNIAVDVEIENGHCTGILAINDISGEMIIYQSKHIICCTGGCGQVFKYTSNPDVATGDGVALAYRAGAEIMDMEFVQFHPTVLTCKQDNRFLISEAVRGEGAFLRNHLGERFMHKYHELQELAPRDVVARAIFSEMQLSGEDNVWLDITHKDKEWLTNRFPNIYETLLGYGIDMSKDMIPVAPAAHYSMGGIKVDVNGCTNIPGLYACGEASCTGVHGANRLASNSLLEGLVFGMKIAQRLSNDAARRNMNIKIELNEVTLAEGIKNIVSKNWNIEKFTFDEDIRVQELINKLKRTMTKKVGIVREKTILEEAKAETEGMLDQARRLNVRNVQWIELINMLQVSLLIIRGALARKESRGAHYRKDYPNTDDINWNKNIIWTNMTNH